MDNIGETVNLIIPLSKFSSMNLNDIYLFNGTIVTNKSKTANVYTKALEVCSIEAQEIICINSKNELKIADMEISYEDFKWITANYRKLRAFVFNKVFSDSKERNVVLNCLLEAVMFGYKEGLKLNVLCENNDATVSRLFNGLGAIFPRSALTINSSSGSSFVDCAFHSNKALLVDCDSAMSNGNSSIKRIALQKSSSLSCLTDCFQEVSLSLPNSCAVKTKICKTKQKRVDLKKMQLEQFDCFVIFNEGKEFKVDREKVRKLMEIKPKENILMSQSKKVTFDNFSIEDLIYVDEINFESHFLKNSIKMAKTVTAEDTSEIKRRFMIEKYNLLATHFFKPELENEAGLLLVHVCDHLKELVSSAGCSGFALVKKEKIMNLLLKLALINARMELRNTVSSEAIIDAYLLAKACLERTVQFELLDEHVKVFKSASSQVTYVLDIIKGIVEKQGSREFTKETLLKELKLEEIKGQLNNILEKLDQSSIVMHRKDNLYKLIN